MVRVTFSQSGGIYNSYSMVARDLWQRKPPLSSGYALGLRSIYCHKSLALCYNYNIYCQNEESDESLLLNASRLRATNATYLWFYCPPSPSIGITLCYYHYGCLSSI